MKILASTRVVGQALRLPIHKRGRRSVCPTIVFIAIAFCANAATPIVPINIGIAKAQVPTWSQDDLNFFLHGSMGTEVVPEVVLRAFIRTYPDLFPTQDLSHLGLIPDSEFGWPIGFSRNKEVKHLGGMSAIGINCASCHFVQMTSAST